MPTVIDPAKNPAANHMSVHPQAGRPTISVCNFGVVVTKLQAESTCHDLNQLDERTSDSDLDIAKFLGNVNFKF